jgi:putative CocE/NonD family hydrolase
VRLSWVILVLGCTLPAVPASVGTIKEFHVRIAMRDGVHLAANIFRPSQPGRIPAILMRTPYNKGDDITSHYQAFVDQGYAIVVQDVRGRYESDGLFQPLTQEPRDGDDTLNWIARQPWSDGKIGMMGGSYLGIVQWKVAILNNPHLKAIFPVVSGYDDYRDRFYSNGGAMKLGNRLLWMSGNVRARDFQPPEFIQFVRAWPLRQADRVATGLTCDWYQKSLDHPGYDSFWQSISTRAQIQRVRVPVFSVGGWYDNFVESDLEAYAALRRSSGLHRILIGPWPHNMSMKFRGVDFGRESTVALRGLQLQWFDQWLKSKDTPLLSRPPVRIFVMGANRWREEREWPLPRTRWTPVYLDSKGRANSLNGDGGLVWKAPRRKFRDGFVYDPVNPVPTLGGAVCCNPKVFAWGPMDQRPVERRSDVLVYTSPPLHRDLEVTGPVRVVLYASTSARDTDFTAKLVDVFPNGEARNLTDGILRLRYRQSLEKPEIANPAEIYKITIDAGPTSNVFLKGHRIRLEISSSNFPRFDRNPNTGRPIADETEMRNASQTVYHDRLHLSQVVLPVVPLNGNTTTDSKRVN